MIFYQYFAAIVNVISQKNNMAIIAPSLLAANFLKLEETCKMLNESEADWYHLDIMDGRFVPNISMKSQFYFKVFKLQLIINYNIYIAYQ